MKLKLNAEVTSSSFLDSSCSLKRKRPPKIQIPNVLREIPAEELAFRDFTPMNDAVSFCVAGVGISSVKGKKQFMEDTHKILSCLQDNSNKAFFGVYDGHGGRKAADYVAENLHDNIFELMKNCTRNEEKVEAIKAGYLKTDEEFLKQDAAGGACCVTALIEGQDIVVANVGDCRAVLCRGGLAEALTTDHKPEKEDERKRIENKGGYVLMHHGAWRVHGTLSISRSIGDAHMKNWIPAEPDTKILQMTQDMDFLVLASDGLWEKVGNQEAVDIVTDLLVGKKLGTGDFIKDNHDDCGCLNVNVSVNASPSSKLRRVSLVKKLRETSQSPRFKPTINNQKDNEDDIPCENESPPSKLRKVSLTKRVSVQPDIPNQENASKIGPPSAGLLAACTELVNLAVSRGSLDDITVMIIDLNHFRCNN
ncbi:hypothetical protein SLEP1_g25452 [Rubroshorea leprosula]|uniref:protein-serine/threonine phosphatase n=1 Tax=Rubroshorea leprosula TaxID=152421 RepID=A0AAV5JTA1_9ROSI|nr:hypothetical protein SLEP1_g25452 [Rubroshorea leprosula]